MGALSGLSIGFKSNEFELDSKSGVRTIKSGDLFEVSIVTFPMNDGARISAVKSCEELKTWGDVETYLRDEGSFSRSKAKTLIHYIKSIAGPDAGQIDEEMARRVLALLSKRI
jgi:hypothetical protein